MKTLNNKNFLIFVLIIFIIMTSILGSMTAVNINKINNTNAKIDVIEKKNKVSENKAIRLQNLKKDISEYEIKVDKIKNNPSSLKEGVENVLNKFCEIMTYKAKETTPESIKKQLLSCVTKECLDTQVSEMFLFSENPAFLVKRTLTSISYDGYNDKKPHILAKVLYKTGVETGTEFYDCVLKFNKSVNAYYISNISVMDTN